MVVEQKEPFWPDPRTPFMEALWSAKLKGFLNRLFSVLGSTKVYQENFDFSYYIELKEIYYYVTGGFLQQKSFLHSVVQENCLKFYIFKILFILEN